MYLYNNNQTKSGCEIYDRVCGCERPTWNVVAGIYLGGGSRLEKAKVNPPSPSSVEKSVSMAPIWNSGTRVLLHPRNFPGFRQLVPI